MTETTKLKLKKPAQNELYNIDVQNQNMDIIDTNSVELSGKIDTVGARVDTVGTQVDTVQSNMNDLVAGFSEAIDGINTDLANHIIYIDENSNNIVELNEKILDLKAHRPFDEALAKVITFGGRKFIEIQMFPRNAKYPREKLIEALQGEKLKIRIKKYHNKDTNIASATFILEVDQDVSNVSNPDAPVYGNTLFSQLSPSFYFSYTECNEDQYNYFHIRVINTEAMNELISFVESCDGYDSNLFDQNPKFFVELTRYPNGWYSS